MAVTIATNIRLPEDLLKALKYRAIEEKKSMNQMIREAIEMSLAAMPRPEGSQEDPFEEGRAEERLVKPLPGRFGGNRPGLKGPEIAQGPVERRVDVTSNRVRQALALGEEPVPVLRHRPEPEKRQEKRRDEEPDDHQGDRASRETAAGARSRIDHRGPPRLRLAAIFRISSVSPWKRITTRRPSATNETS